MTLVVEPEIQWYLDRHLSHQTHNSTRRAFRSCRRRWSWVYRDMYQPVTQAAPLEFGIAFHEAMEVFYEPRTWGSALEIRTDLALVAFRRKCSAQLKEYMKLNPDPDVTVLDSYKERLELGLNMIRYYCNNMSPHYDRRWTPIRVEVSFEVPIKHPDTGQQLWCKCNPCWVRWKKSKDGIEHHDKWQESLPEEEREIGLSDKIYREVVWDGLPVTYGGRLDALFQDELARYWVADWKTTARMLDEDAEASFLQLDDQIAGYLWALEQYGIHCAGFIYVEIKKAFPQAPEVLSRKYKGRIVSTNKQFLTTPELALKSIQHHDHDGWQMGLYDDYLDWLKFEGPKFTQRHQIHKNEHEIKMAGEVIAREVLDMINDPAIYPQPGRFSCNWCLFKQPCLGMNMGEDYQYTLDTMFVKETQYYWEIKAASTE